MSTPTPARERPPLLAVVFNYVLYILMIAIFSVALFLVWPSLVSEVGRRLGGASLATPTAAPQGNVGGQAPPAVRGTNPDPIVAPEAPRVIATPIPGIAQSPAEADKLYADAIATAEPIAPIVEAAPLPLNSAGAPVIDARQLSQQAQALELAAQEAASAARAAQLADDASRAPDVSYDDAKALLGRDPCHVPRADPATCARGLFKPTPIGAP